MHMVGVHTMSGAALLKRSGPYAHGWGCAWPQARGLRSQGLPYPTVAQSGAPQGDQVVPPGVLKR
jgi:hypothetical protein